MSSFSLHFVGFALLSFNLVTGVEIVSSPNVLFIVADDLRPFLGAYGDTVAVTPNIDLIASRGVVLNRAYCQQALCGPSRTSFLTSRRPDTTRLYDFYSYWRTAAGNFTTLPQHLKHYGYHTVSVGKIFHPGIASNFTDDYPYSWSEVPYRPSTEAYMRAKVCTGPDGKLHENIVCPVEVETQPEGTLPDLQSSEYAVKFLRRWKAINKQNQPFFLAVGFHKPHIPLKYPKKYLNLYPIETIPLASDRGMTKGLPTVAWNPWTDLREREDVQALKPEFPYGPLPDDYQRLVRQSYYAAVTFMDDQVGQVLSALKDENFADNTIIILIGDHGWAMGEHQEWSKYSNFEVAVKVPFIISVPGLTCCLGGNVDAFTPVSTINGLDSNTSRICWRTNFTSSDAIVELVDIFPTVVELVGLNPIKTCSKHSRKEIICTEGTSLVPVIQNAVRDRSLNIWDKTKTDTAFSQYPRPSIQPQNSSDKPRLKQIKIMGYTIRTPKYRYTEWVLFDHNTFSGNWSHVFAEELYVHSMTEKVSEDVNVASKLKFRKIKRKLSNRLRKKNKRFKET